MISRAVHIVISLLFIISTAGFTVSKHYCGQSLVDTAINAEPDPCCEGGCAPDCCHNETDHFQLKVDFISQVDIQSLTENSISDHYQIVAESPEVDFYDPITVLLSSPELREPPDHPAGREVLSLLQTYRC